MAKRKTRRAGSVIGRRALQIVQKYVPAVESVEDATDAIEIEVTKADAASKAVRNHQACAMAVACKRKFHLQDIIISRSVAYLIRRNVATRYILPEHVSREVVAFDRGGSFAPGTYTLNAPPLADRLDSPRQEVGGHQHTAAAGGGRGRAHHPTVDIRAALLPGHRDK